MSRTPGSTAPSTSLGIRSGFVVHFSVTAFSGTCFGKRSSIHALGHWQGGRVGTFFMYLNDVPKGPAGPLKAAGDHDVSFGICSFLSDKVICLKKVLTAKRFISTRHKSST